MNSDSPNVDANVDAHTIQQWDLDSTHCGCNSCTSATWSTYAGAYQCGARIDYKSGPWGGNLSPEDACHYVSNEFPTICGPSCHPDQCDATDPPTSAPVPPPPAPLPEPDNCGCHACTDAVWTTYAGAYTCGSRIDYKSGPWGGNLSPEDACRYVSNEFPTICGPSCHPDQCDATDPPTSMPPPPCCGCESCSDDVWNHAAGGSHTCGARIDWLQTNDGGGSSQLDACRYVSEEYPNGECGPMCHPELCDAGCALYAEPYVAPADISTKSPLQATDGLYCFPAYSARERYTNVFGGGYTIETKDGQGGVCGPGDNMFISDIVSYDAATQELTMEYKKVGEAWAGSEVRILLPESEGLTFGYGTFDFSVKSVSVLDGDDNIVSTALPSDLVLGLFTWDITDNYVVNENWNHEVDIEISQWGNPANAQDVQFLTQPHHPGGPHFPTRMSSGGPVTTPADFDQGGHTYGFTWKPDEISWSTDAGGGQSRVYSTQIAKDACAEDYIQCLPANVEVRINLWNNMGDDLAPDVTGVTDGTKVKVVIDDFSFAEHAIDHVPNGGTCSKHCQCAAWSICGETGTCAVS